MYRFCCQCLSVLLVSLFEVVGLNSLLSNYFAVDMQQMSCNFRMKQLVKIPHLYLFCPHLYIFLWFFFIFCPPQRQK